MQLSAMYELGWCHYLLLDFEKCRCPSPACPHARVLTPQVNPTAAHRRVLLEQLSRRYLASFFLSLSLSFALHELMD